MPLQEVHELTFLWLGLPGPLLNISLKFPQNFTRISPEVSLEFYQNFTRILLLPHCPEER